MLKRGILYAIADRKMGDEGILEALAAGVDMIQLREKGQTAAKYLEDARWLREQTDKTGTLFLVNDRLDIALASGADGVHLGQSDLPVQEAKRIVCMMGRPNFLIGATARTAEQARRAFEGGADYIGSGAWYETATKEDARLLSEETYLKILEATPIPNVAIGGLTPENCIRPLRLGAAGIAAAFGIFGADSVTEKVAAFRRRLAEIG
ncbi:MAG: thiamine phosphate synthase [Lachnospiraceae bacterium]|nr:thiamine phosphate synthase [Lachnospiraceae bacterium]